MNWSKEICIWLSESIGRVGKLSLVMGHQWLVLRSNCRSSEFAAHRLSLSTLEKTIFVKIEDNCSYEFVFCLSHLCLYCTCCIQIICLSLLAWSFCVRLLNWLLLILFFSDLDTLYSASYGMYSRFIIGLANSVFVWRLE